jgi:hypothetical protein
MDTQIIEFPCAGGYEIDFAAILSDIRGEDLITKRYIVPTTLTDQGE